MNKQKGAALIVVLLLLSISLMVGLSSMTMSNTNEILSGNYRMYTDAQQSAEATASGMVTLAIESNMQAGDEVLGSCPSFSDLQDISSSASYCFTEERSVGGNEGGNEGDEEAGGTKISGVACFLDPESVRPAPRNASNLLNCMAI